MHRWASKKLWCCNYSPFRRNSYIKQLLVTPTWINISDYLGVVVIKDTRKTTLSIPLTIRSFLKILIVLGHHLKKGLETWDPKISRKSFASMKHIRNNVFLYGYLTNLWISTWAMASLVYSLLKLPLSMSCQYSYHLLLGYDLKT